MYRSPFIACVIFPRCGIEYAYGKGVEIIVFCVDLVGLSLNLRQSWMGVSFSMEVDITQQLGIKPKSQEWHPWMLSLHYCCNNVERRDRTLANLPLQGSALPLSYFDIGPGGVEPSILPCKGNVLPLNYRPMKKLAINDISRINHLLYLISGNP